MSQFFDADGNPVDNVVTAEDLQVLKEKADRAEAIETELKKLQEKEFNFQQFRNKNKEEQEKLKGELSAKERMLMDKIEALETQMVQRESASVTETKEKYLASLAGSDVEYKKMLEAEFTRLPGDAITPDQIANKMAEANALVQFRNTNRANPSPIHTFVPPHYNSVNELAPRNKSFADTPEGQAVAKSLGLKTGA